MKRERTGTLPASRLWFLALAAVLAAGCAPAGTSGHATAPPSRSQARLTVTSTLDGHATLPHRIHWQAFPSAPPTDVTDVDFLIDGHQLWVEHNTPYFYGDDGNYLVTSFLTPGKHVFTVRAIALIGSRAETATDSVTATVPPAPAPPAALAGTWKAWAPAGAAPAGYASLVITSVGWYEGGFPVVFPPASLQNVEGGNLEDVAYLAPGLVEIRTGMATGHDHVVGIPDNDLNGWCNDAPGSPARYRWSVTGNHLRFTFVSGHPCPGFTKFLKLNWTWVSKRTSWPAAPRLLP